MINIRRFVEELKKNNLDFCSGVPDSLFKDLCFEFEKEFKKKHLTAANEGSAIALGVVYHVSSKKIPIIYMQNSGLGNAINPLISLADKKVYNIPMFLIIGWRGETKKNFKDEPQHLTQGKVTEKFLSNLSIKYKILNKNSDYKKIVKKLSEKAKKSNELVALLVRKNTFESKNKVKVKNSKFLLREEVLNLILKKIPSKSIIVSTTGILSRELNEINKLKNLKLNNFMCVGGMGHAISVAAGMASNLKKKVYCFDGDGAITMHLGSLATSSKKNNIVHIILNNFSHESVGGHENSAKHVKFYRLAKELGYKTTYLCKNKNEILQSIKKSQYSKKSTFIEIITKNGHRKNISRPKEKMISLKNNFIKKVTNEKINK